MKCLFRGIAVALALAMPATSAVHSADAPSPAAGPLASGSEPAPHRGAYEIALEAHDAIDGPFFPALLTVTVTRPDGSHAVVEGCFDGGRLCKARAYCDHLFPAG